MNFKHFIITRFNLSKRWDKDKYGNTILDSTWLTDRYSLFEDFCLPSIKSQTSKNFEWWVYFDSNIDDFYKKKNDKLNKDFPNFKPKYKNSYDDFQNNMHLDVWKNALKQEVDYLLTTRLDNDDVLAKDTVELLQSFQLKAPYLLEIPFGYKLEIDENPKLRKSYSLLNSFISLYEEVNGDVPIISVYAFEHDKWNSIKSIKASEKPQWIQIIHDKNVFNKANGEEIIPFGLSRRFMFDGPKFRYLNIIKRVVQQRLKNLLFFLKDGLNKYFKKMNFKKYIYRKVKAIIQENRERHKYNTDLIKRNEPLLKELEWAQVYHDSIRGKECLEKLPLNIGRWAGNYAFFYVLNRVLNDYKPNRILEFGLGESSKFIATFIENYLLESEHLIVEQDKVWYEIFQQNFNLYSRSKVVICPLQEIEIKGYTVNSYSNFQDKTQEKFDLYVVDGPFGSEHFSRYEIVSLAEKFSVDDDFIIIFDDYHRNGEKETVSDLLQLFKFKNIKTYQGIYSGNKTVMIIATEKYKYIESL